MSPPKGSAAAHHGRRLASSGEPLGQPRAPIDAEWVGEHVGGDATVGDLAVGELFTGQAGALLYLIGTWGRVDHGPLLLVIMGVWTGCT